MAGAAPSELGNSLQQLSAPVERLSGEREVYRQLYLSLLERCEQLERGIIAERHASDSPQLSCQFHGVEPWAYLRDLFCLLLAWPKSRVRELALVFWKQTPSWRALKSARRQCLPRRHARRAYTWCSQ